MAAGLRRGHLALAGGGIALLGIMVVAASVGPVAIAPADTAAIILHHLGLPAPAIESSAHDRIIWDVRLPRVFSAALVGAALSISGASYQAVFRNPLADPYLIGVASGAALGATIAIISPLPLDFYSFGYVALFAFLGAMAAVAITYELARVGRTVPVTSHVLAGVAVAAAASAATSLLMMLNETRLFVVFAWLYGDFTTASWSKLESVAPYLAAAMVVLLLAAHRLNVLQLGEDEARTLGVRVERLKVLVIVVASLATAVSVAISGLIGFVGLVVPHVCRLLFGPDHRVLLPASLLGGAAFLVLADTAARTVLAPQELPVGILTAAVGAPFFLFLLRRQRRGVGL
jgi:iron complex transport system permease protein